MLYLSQLLNAPVEDLHGVRIGKIVDILALRTQVGQAAPAYPTALLIEGEEEQFWRVPPGVVEWHDDALRLRIPIDQLTVQPSDPLAEEVSLAHDVYDKQVIDIERKKTFRVNDVYLGNDWQLLGVDNSIFGVVRRLAPSWLLGERSKHAPTDLIPWEHIELVNPQHTGEHEAIPPSLLRAQSGHLAELHPADIAEIVHQLTPGQGARLIEGLDDETAADTMEEIDTERQRHILENISADRAADILETMEPDEAADLLAQLPEDRAQELLNLMQPEESEDVQELLEYEEDTAGGLMTTDYLVLTSTRSVSEALEAVRHYIQEQNVRVAYVYCAEDETQEESPLLGMVSVWDLLVAVPTQLLEEFMETDLVKVQLDTDAHTVAQIMAKYNLLAVPVVSENGILEGIVTVDDALDVVLPNDKRRKPTRMY